MPVNIQLSKISIASAISSTISDSLIAETADRLLLVGLGGIEPPTSPLSGVRSSHLSYRPRMPSHWWSWSGSNRRPPECKSGALPAELQPLSFSSAPAPSAAPTASRFNRGQLDAETTGPAHGRFRKTRRSPSGDPERAHPLPPKGSRTVWSGTAASYSRPLYTQAHLAFGNSTHVLS